MESHVLVVMPHPDDETFACGGTIALHAQAGTPVTYLCGTRGEMGRNMGNPPFATRESLPILREKELREACQALGISDLRLMGLRDKTVEFVDPDELANRIGSVIEELQPSLILSYHPRFSVHPDHMAMAAALVRAVASLPPEKRPPVHCRAFGPGHEQLGEPDLVVDVSPVLDRKLAAIQAHRSQSEPMLKVQETKAKADPKFREERQKELSRECFWIYRFE